MLTQLAAQIFENFKRQSGESLSLAFLSIWLAGDVFNVVGGILQHVLPTMVSLGISNRADVRLSWASTIPWPI